MDRKIHSAMAAHTQEQSRAYPELFAALGHIHGGVDCQTMVSYASVLPRVMQPQVHTELRAVRASCRSCSLLRRMASSRVVSTELTPARTRMASIVAPRRCASMYYMARRCCELQTCRIERG